MKALVGMILVFAMIAAACSGSGNKAKESPSASSAASPSASQSTAPSESSAAPEPTPEPVTLKIYGPGFAHSFSSGVQSDDVALEIARITGVTMDIEAKPEEAKFKAMLASGDLPDIIVGARKDIQALVEGGNVIPLDDLIKTNGQNLESEKPDRLKASREFYSNGTGKLYFIPGYAGPIPSHYDHYAAPAYAVRWDLYKELGYPEYSNEFDVLPILADMQKLYPENEQGQKVYAMAPLFAVWGLHMYTFPIMFKNMSHVMKGFVDINLADLSAKSYLFDPQGSFWNGARFYNKANQLGILDPESFTQTFDTHVEKGKSNRILFAWHDWTLGGPNQLFVQNGEPLKGWQGLPPAKGGTLYRGEYSDLGAEHLMWGITKNSKHPERAMDWLNFMFSYDGARLIINGIEGKHWNEENGKPIVVPDVLAKRAVYDADIYLTAGIGKYSNYNGYSPGTYDPRFNIPLDYMLNEELYIANQTELDKDFSSYYGAKYPGDVIQQKAAAGEISFSATNYSDFLAMPSSPPEDIGRLDAQIEEYLKRQGPKLVLAKSDAEFEKVLEDSMAELRTMGAEKSVEFWENAYKENQEKMKALKNG